MSMPYIFEKNRTEIVNGFKKVNMNISKANQFLVPCGISRLNGKKLPIYRDVL